MHKPPPHPMNEDERIRALKRYRILDTDPEPQFDRVAAIAKRQFAMPLALVTFVDSERNFLKARGDLPFADSPRDISFCGHTILSDEVLVVPDASKDERFAQNPLVEGDFHVRFYAGAPLITPNGERIGTVCVFDTKPHDDFDFGEQAKLRDLAAIVADHLEMRLIVGNVHDEIETRRLAEAEARHIALHDTLTDLPNRAYLKKVIDTGLPFEADGVVAALSADLDELKSVNEVLGHQAGDEVLRRVAETIRATVGDNAFAARVGGDEFVVLIACDSRESARSIATRLVEATRSPTSLDGTLVSAKFSIGIGFCEPGETDVEAAIKRADLALLEAKRARHGEPVTFNDEMQQAADRRRRLEQDLKAAIEARGIEVHYQPICSAASGAMIGVEALARWNHFELGFISPVEFIALAEETGQILDLGEQILRIALADGRDWGDLFVSVNLSPVQFRLADLTGLVERLLTEMRFAARRLQLEITEGVLFHDVEQAKRQIEALRALGIKVALDDFGTGYSSLSYLRSLPFDKVKIDRSFVQGLGADTTSHAIVQLIVGLARELVMHVTAEGIESEAEAILLRAMGVDSFQGYYFGKPMPAAEITPQLAPETLQAKRAAAG